MQNKWLGLAPFVALCAASATHAAEDKAPKPVSAFVLCDGRIGHVGFAATLGRLVAVTATAGLSEVATAKDDASRRLKGADGAAACESAIAEEGDGWRRMELAQAKAIHLIEADKLDEALVAVRAIPGVAGDFGTDWGYRHTVLPRATLLEADILVRLKRPDEAERTAIKALAMAPYDVALLKRAMRYLDLNPALYPEKAAALAQASRLMPETLGSRMAAHVAIRDFKAADADVSALNDLSAGFAQDPSKRRPEEIMAYRSVLQMLAGDAAASNALADEVKASLVTLASSGYTVEHGQQIAEISEILSLQSVLRDAAEGRASSSRATFRAHGPWLLAMREVVLAVTDRLRENAPADDLSGTLADSGAALRARNLAARTASMSKPETIPVLYTQAAYSAKAGAYSGAAAATWKVSPKPQFVMKRSDKDPAPYDFINTLPRVNGLPSGEALLLHAALVARSRGNKSFVVLPVRPYLYMTSVRFGDKGQPGFPEIAAFDAEQVITDIGAYIPEPMPGK